ncbi:MAG TPA: small acid-soluble spore protein Tlp [Clostridiaceae bacterium]
MLNKPDDRTDNVERIQYNIDKTNKNSELADDMIEITDDEKTKENLEAKNERRETALRSMKKEIKQEAIDKENGYK